MGFDFNEAREIVEAAKKRGVIRNAGEAAPVRKQEERKTEISSLPDWLQEGLQRPAAPPQE